MTVPAPAEPPPAGPPPAGRPSAPVPAAVLAEQAALTDDAAAPADAESPPDAEDPPDPVDRLGAEPEAGVEPTAAADLTAAAEPAVPAGTVSGAESGVAGDGAVTGGSVLADESVPAGGSVLAGGSVPAGGPVPAGGSALAGDAAVAEGSGVAGESMLANDGADPVDPDWPDPPSVGPAAWRPRPYPQLLRGPQHHWWRPPLGLGVLLGSVAVLVIGFGLFADLIKVLAGSSNNSPPAGSVPPPVDAHGPVSALDLLGLNLSVAAFLPLAVFAVWAAHRWGPGYLASVTGRLRWGWLGRCLAVCALTLGPLAILLSLLGGVLTSPHERNWVPILAVALLTTPLQAASEEYLFRGWLNQTVGSLFEHTRAATVAGAVVSSTLFAFAHGSQDVWLFADRWVFGAVAATLAWRTGGLEAGIALHTSFNLAAWAQAVAFGSLSETVNGSSMSPLSFVLDTAQVLIVASALSWLAGRDRPARLFRPVAVDG